MLLRLSVFCFSIFIANFSHADSLSKWDQFVKTADQEKLHECVFPDAPDHKAPAWLCDGVVAGVEVSAVGQGKYFEPAGGKEDKSVKKHKGNYRNFIPGSIKAYMDALLKAKMELDVNVRNMIRQYLVSKGKSDSDKIDKSLNEIVKNISSLKSVSGNTSYSSLTKSYTETTKNSEERVSTAIRKIVYNSNDCQFVYKSYLEVQSNSSKKSVVDRVESNVQRGQCGFGSLVDDMEASGYKLMKMLKSPNDYYYVLIGVTNIEAVAKGAIKNSLANESKLWQEFMDKKK